MPAKLNKQNTRPPDCPRILLVEDDPAMNMLLSMLIDRSDEVKLDAAAATASEARAQIRESKADLVLLDWHLPDGTGEQLLPEILEARPQIKVLFMSTLFVPDRVSQALNDGAHGFVDKWRLEQDLFEAIRTVLRGDYFASPPVDLLVRRHLSQREQSTDGRHPAG